MLKYLILRYVQVIFTLFLKQILGIIIILITWSYVLQDIFVDLEMTGMDEVMFRPPPPHPLTPSNFLLRHCAVKFFLGDSVLYKVSEFLSFLHSDGPLQHNLSFCDFRFKYLANYCIMSNLTFWT